MAIKRTIDSGNDGGVFKHTPALLALKGFAPPVLVAIHGNNGLLKLLTYRATALDANGKIIRLADSGTEGAPMTQSPAIAPVRDIGYVSAVCNQNSDLRLTTWQIPDHGQSITAISNSGNQSMPIKHSPSIAGVDVDEVVTATVGYSNRLKIVRWGVSSDLHFIERGGDSGNNGPLSSSPAFAVALHAQLVAVAYADDSEHLRIQLYHLTPGSKGDPFTVANSGNQAGKIKGTLRLIRLSNNLLATAVCTQSDRLKVVLWQYSADGKTITRAGSIDEADEETITTIPNIASVQDGQFVTAIRTVAGGLKLLRWSYSADGKRITKIADSGDAEQTGEISSVPGLVVREQPSQDHWLTTAVRTNEGRLKLIAWQ